MPPKKPKLRDDELFRMQLTNMIDMDHPLVKVAQLIDWSQFDEGFGQFYTQKGRPGLPTRLLAGLHLLKHMEGLSDEAVCKRWVENPYYQYFCGEQYFRHKLPLDRSSMTRWRGRIGPEKLELLLAQTLAVAMQTNAVTPQAFERVTLDTTVQTKAVAHPTDSHLLMRGIELLNRLAKKHGIALRQSFLRVGRRARRDVSRLIHGRGHKQAMRWVRKMRTWLGRLDRDIGRKIAGNATLEAAFAVPRERIARVLTQKAGDAHKLYALHAPEVECIAKGKARTRYEFGVKTSIAVTNARTAGGQFIVGMQALPGSPYDGHTLTGQITRSNVSPAWSSSAPMSIAATGGTDIKAKPRFISPTAVASRHRQSSESFVEETPSSRLSGTPRATAFSSAITWLVRPATPSTPSWSPPATTCACSSHGSQPFGMP